MCGQCDDLYSQKEIKRVTPTGRNSAMQLRLRVTENDLHVVLCLSVLLRR